MARANKTAAPSAPQRAPSAAPSAPKKPMFYSYDGTDRKIDLPDGRVAIVGATPRYLEPAFWKAALRNGCGSTSQPDPALMRLPDAPVATDAFRRRGVIERAISDALSQPVDSMDPAFTDAVTLEGSINMSWLNKHVGFIVERSERDDAYRKVVAEAEAEEEAGGQEADALDLASDGNSSAADDD